MNSNHFRFESFCHFFFFCWFFCLLFTVFRPSFSVTFLIYIRSVDSCFWSVLFGYFSSSSFNDDEEYEKGGKKVSGTKSWWWRFVLLKWIECHCKTLWSFFCVLFSKFFFSTLRTFLLLLLLLSLSMLIAITYGWICIVSNNFIRKKSTYIYKHLIPFFLYIEFSSHRMTDIDSFDIWRISFFFFYSGIK